MVSCLLRKGANPNHIIPIIIVGAGTYEVRSVWAEVVKTIVKLKQGRIAPEWEMIASLMMEYGADETILPELKSGSGRKVLNVALRTVRQLRRRVLPHLDPWG
jgi:hypothetical protein